MNLKAEKNPDAIALSPYHEIELPEAYRHWAEHAPQQDQVIRTLSKKLANGQPLIQGDLVVAGRESRETWPLATQYPVHFRKTYYPTCFHQHPDIEFRHHEKAAQLLDVPAPIGATRTSFRSCFIPGDSLRKLSPFGVEPIDANIAIAEKLDHLHLIGYWRLLEEVYGQVTRLHEGGLAHGDLFIHNVIVSLAPVGIFLIDFELSVDRDEAGDEEKWEKAVREDFREILLEAVCVQCGLGIQAGPLAEHSLEELESLTGTAHDRFVRALRGTRGS